MGSDEQFERLFARLLEAWNHYEDLQAGGAPPWEVVSARERVDKLRMRIIERRRAVPPNVPTQV